MDRLFQSISSLGDPKIGSGDSFSDRLNNQVTVFLLFFFAILITVQEHYINQPVYCWHPEHFTSSHENYTNQICWVRDTYYLPPEEPIPAEGEPRDYIFYYQWVGFILAIQAICFYLPKICWDVLSRISGFSVTTVTDAALQCQRETNIESRDKTLRYMAGHLSNYLRQAEAYAYQSKVNRFLNKFNGNMLSFFYLLVKIFYLVNIAGQVFILDHFLGFKFHILGWNVLDRFAKGQEVSVLNRFPRMNMCDFKIRLLGNLHRYTVQCALPINLYNEMIFTVLWFWFVFVGVVTFISFLFWTRRVLYIPHHISFVTAQLVGIASITDVERLKVKVEIFTRTFLGRDGVLIVHLVSKNASGLLASELLGGLWKNFATITEQRRVSRAAVSFIDDDSHRAVRTPEKKDLVANEQTDENTF